MLTMYLFIGFNIEKTFHPPTDGHDELAHHCQMNVNEEEMNEEIVIPEALDAELIKIPGKGVAELFC